jgi:hypothetical protein
VLTIILLELALPVGLLLWLALWPHSSRIAWSLSVALAGCLFGLLHLAGLWLVLPWYLPAVYGLLVIPAGFVIWRRLPPPSHAPLSTGQRVAGRNGYVQALRASTRDERVRCP